ELIADITRAARAATASQRASYAVNSIAQALSPKEAVLRHEVHARMQSQAQRGSGIDHIGRADQPDLPGICRKRKQRTERLGIGVAPVSVAARDIRANAEPGDQFRFGEGVACIRSGGKAVNLAGAEGA